MVKHFDNYSAAANDLRKHGYEVSEMRNGFTVWRKEGFRARVHSVHNSEAVSVVYWTVTTKQEA